MLASLSMSWKQAWGKRVDGAVEPRKLIVQEEGDTQVCVLWRYVPAPTGPCGNEACHVPGDCVGMCTCVR